MAEDRCHRRQAIGHSIRLQQGDVVDVFPRVPPDVYKAKVVDIFKRLAKEMAGDVPPEGHQ